MSQTNDLCFTWKIIKETRLLCYDDDGDPSDLLQFQNSVKHFERHIRVCLSGIFEVFDMQSVFVRGSYYVAN